MGARSSRNTAQNNRSDGHLLEYSRQSFVRGGGANAGPTVAPFSATGGAKSTPGDGYAYHVFTSSPSTLSRDTGPTTVPLDILLVAGGGGGASGTPTGGAGGGGGGAGGLIEIQNLLTDFSSSITITIGTGGSRSPDSYYVQGTPGGDSTFAPGTPQALTAKGGGAGAAYQYAGPKPGGAPGGSGGGACGGAPYTGGAALQPSQPGNSGTYGYGYAGSGTPGDNGSGGGGAGSAGSAGGSSAGGAAGTGRPISWVPPSYGTSGPTPGRWFAGGGAGGSYTAGPITGGSGGGGFGGNWSTSVAGQNGTANTGGGGGGGNNNGVNGAGNGGSGICIVRYPVTYNS